MSNSRKAYLCEKMRKPYAHAYSDTDLEVWYWYYVLGKKYTYVLGKKYTMAKPIDPTPTLHGEDAYRLLRDLEDVCNPDEARARVTMARQELAEMMRPKTGGKTPSSVTLPTSKWSNH